MTEGSASPDNILGGIHRIGPSLYGAPEEIINGTSEGSDVLLHFFYFFVEGGGGEGRGSEVQHAPLEAESVMGTVGNTVSAGR